MKTLREIVHKRLWWHNKAEHQEMSKDAQEEKFDQELRDMDHVEFMELLDEAVDQKIEEALKDAGISVR